MALEPEKIREDAKSPPASAENLQTEVHVSDNERTKTTRHPRWSRQETIILIGAKKMVENGGTPVCRFTQSEPKWDSVSSFCQKHGVNRGPVQCRKRWSNLLSDFKKIKKWETNIKHESESFWMMRNDERRDKKLPGFFDGEVYNVLNGEACTASAFPLTLIKVSKAENGDGGNAMASEQCEEDEDEEDEAIVDSEKMAWSTEDEAFEIITSAKKVTDPLNASGVEETIMIGNPEKTPAHHRLSSGTMSSPKEIASVLIFVHFIPNSDLILLRKYSHLKLNFVSNSWISKTVITTDQTWMVFPKIIHWYFIQQNQHRH